MKIVKIASAAIVALLASSMVSCTKQEEKEQAPVQEVTFSVELNMTEAEYAEVVVRHDGAESDKWFGFVTTDLTSDVNDLIAAQVSQVDKKKLHVGKAQTVAVRSLAEHVNYRYIAFGVNEDGTAFGNPGSLAFCSSPKFNVTFAAEASSVEAHKATFAVSHNGIEALTYLAFITDDTTSEAATLAAADFAKNVKDGKLVDGVTLLSGTAKTVSFEELTHETSYRLIVYGLFDNNGSVVYYGTPADVAFTTSVDLALVQFSATASDLTKNSVNIAVSYNAKKADLTWYSFYTQDLTTDLTALIAANVAGISADKYQSGAKTVAVEGLEPETTYRVVVTGITAEGVYGTPAEVQFTTLTAAYDNTVFTVAASDITPYAVTFTVTHTGWEEFQYAGFFTEDMTSALADVALPSNIDSDLMSGKEKTYTVENLTPNKSYRYIVVGRVQGNEYGTRGEVLFSTLDNVISLNYEDFIGSWKINGQIFTVSQKESGVSYFIDGLPGSSAARGGLSTLVAEYDAQNGQLFVVDQDLAQYDDPSTNNYGPLRDFYAGATWTTMSNGTERYWPNYPFRTATKSEVFRFVGLDNGEYELRGAEGIEASLYGWVILTGSSAGGGNCYSGVIEFPTPVLKFVKKAASYEDFLGNWTFASSTIKISQKVAGSTYSITGLFDVESLYGDVHSVTAQFDANAHELVVMEQKLGAFNTADVSSFGSNQYGDCDDFLTGIFSYGTSTYPGYPYNTDNPYVLFTVFINGDNDGEIICGANSYGPFVGLDFWWIIREGEYAGKGNSYHADGSSYSYETIPEVMTKVGGSSSVAPSSVGSVATRPVVNSQRKLGRTSGADSTIAIFEK